MHSPSFLVPFCRGAKDNKGFGFPLVRGLLLLLLQVTAMVSLILNALVAGNGSYILWSSVALTWGSDTFLQICQLTILYMHCRIFLSVQKTLVIFGNVIFVLLKGKIKDLKYSL